MRWWESRQTDGLNKSSLVSEWCLDCGKLSYQMNKLFLIQEWWNTALNKKVP